LGLKRMCVGRAITRRAWLGAIVVLLSCSRGPADPVRELLQELESAAEARDVDRFGSHLSEGFQGTRGLGRTEALATLRRYFAAYESVGLEVYGVEVDQGEGTAEVRCVVEFAGQARKLAGLQGLLPPSAVYRFELGLGEEDETWRVQRASWEIVLPDDRP